MATEISTSGSSFGSTLTGVANLANLFLGSSNTTQQGGTSTTTNSGGTTVTTNRESVAPGAVDAVVRSILEGTNGLAAVSGGQRSAGLYNSSTNQMLTNDLVARAAAEGAKLNKETTQTTVTPQTTQSQSTAQSGVAQKVAPVSPGIALGGLAALQLIPKSVKDKVLGGISLKGFGSSSGADAGGVTDVTDKLSATDVADPSGNGDFGFGTASVGTDGLNNQTVTGIGNDFLPAGATESVEGGGDAIQDVAGLGGGGDTSVEGLDGSGLGEALGGFLSGAGDLVSGAVESVGSFFDDFDFSFADGGIINAAARRDAMEVHKANKLADGGTPVPAAKPVARTFQQRTLDKRMQDAGETPADVDQPAPVAPAPAVLTPQNPQERKALFNLVNVLPNLLGALTGTTTPTATTTSAAPVAKADGGEVKAKGYANGGIADSRQGSVYDLKGAGYIANTGIRAEGPQALEAVAAESNDSVITRIIRDTSRLATVARPNSSNPLQISSGSNDQNIVGYNSSAGGSQQIQGDSGEAVEGSNIGSVSGISGALGIDSATGRAGTNAGLSALGIGAPGLAGLANAKNNSEAVQSIGLTALGIANPIAGIIASLVMNAMSKSGTINGEADPTAGNKSNALDGFLGLNDNFSQAPGPDVEGGGTEGGNGPTGAEGGGIGGSGNSAGSSDAPGGIGGSNGGDAVAANGGKINGPGTGTSDSIPAKLSDGEYVISADVVEALGVPFFDKLQNKYHTPVKTGRAA